MLVGQTMALEALDVHQKVFITEARLNNAGLSTLVLCFGSVPRH